ncbi:MAG: glycosyltransferase family 9 protein [Nitrospinaceae bacterium]
MKPGERTLILRTGALGDVLMLLPLVHALHSQMGMRVSLGVQAHQTKLLSGFAGVDSAYSTDRLELWRLYGPGPGPAKTWPPGERVIAFLRDEAGDLKERLERVSGAAAVVVPPFPEAASSLHVSRYYLACGLPGPALPGPAPDPSFPRYVPDSPAPAHGVPPPDSAGGAALWAVHPGSGGESKNWNLEGFKRCVRFLESQGVRTALILGPGEESRFHELEAALGGDIIIRGRDLAAVAAFLRRCRGFLGNDSGLTHLAAILGLPTVAVFGPKSTGNWCPLGRKVAWVRGSPGAWPESGSVIAALESLLPQ